VNLVVGVTVSATILLLMIFSYVFSRPCAV
jgi:hypothetical protein